MSRTRLTDQRSDTELVSACNSGNAAEAQAAFATLYRRHKDYVVRVALRFVPDNDSALDVLQETFGYLLRKFPPSGPGLELSAALTTLLYPVAKNSALSIARKSRRFPASDTIGPDDLPGTSPAIESSVQPLLSDLPAERQEVIMMRFVDDLSLQDIATALKIPLGTVKSRLHLAIRQLRGSPKTKNFFDP